MKTLFKTHKLENWQVVSRKYQFLNFGRPPVVKKYHLWKENRKYVKMFYFRYFGNGGPRYVEVVVPGI